MTIIATMLSANNQNIVHDAVCSVIDWVDRFLLIDTGISDDAIRIAEQTAGPKLLVERFKWCADFAKAHNFSLEPAQANGADGVSAMGGGDGGGQTMNTTSQTLISLFDRLRSLRTADRRNGTRSRLPGNLEPIRQIVGEFQ